MERFQDGGLHLRDFRDRYLVLCPQCRARAEVTSERGLSCGRCAFVRRPGTDWFGTSSGIAERPCGRCGMRLFERVPWQPRGRTVSLRCACGAVSDCSVRWSPSADDQARDPVLGCDFLLRASVRGNLFWAWNAAHLAFLRDYVGATLREREPNRNGSLASRLPAWIKAAKNRDDLLAAIESLERTLRASE